MKQPEATRPLKELTKLDVVDQLARRYGYRSLLEISTPTTGLTNGAFDRGQLTHYDRLVYRYSAGSDDGERTFSTEAETSYDLTQHLVRTRATGPGYDMVFVDPYHTHHCTTIDLLGAISLVRTGGTIVVHDCHPTDPQIAGEAFPGLMLAWCGVTYWAFIDFVLGRAGIDYFTVDADFGCGVIRKVRTRTALSDPALELAWENAARFDEARFAFFREHEQQLLHLISPDQFRRRFASRHAASNGRTSSATSTFPSESMPA